jgi:hypothetical protein
MSKKPTKLKITRDGGNFTASWSNHKTGKKSVDKVEYKFCKNQKTKKNKKKKWSNVKKVNKTSKISKFYKNLDLSKTLTNVSFAVRTHAKGGDWSGWVYADEYVVKPPEKPTVSVTEGTYPSATFKWSVEKTGKSENTIFTNVYWRTGLQLESNSIVWEKDSSGKEWRTNANATGTYGPKIENVGVIAGKKYTRHFEVKSKGPGGETKPTSGKIRYSLPNEPQIIPDSDTPLARPDKSYFYVYFKYKIDRSALTPIESIMPQYLIGTPANSELDPPGSGWTDTVKTLPPSGSGVINGASGFNTTSTVGNNQCLWVRVVSKNSDQQNQQSPSDPYLVYLGELSKPDQIDVGPIDSTSFRSVIKATNNSNVPGSFIAIFRIVEGKENCIGIIQNGKTLTVVQFSEVVEDPVIRLYTMAGTYEPSSLLEKTADTQVDDTKLYFELIHSNEVNDYEQLAIDSESTDSPVDKWWYERTTSGSGYTYYYSSDSSVVPEKEYFERKNPKYIFADVSSGVSPAAHHWYEVDGESSFSVDPKWKSKPVEAATTVKTPQNITAGFASSNFSGNVRVNWDWPWKTADVAELSWSKNPDAWESTQEPSKFEITNSKPASWVISDLEAGNKWYIRVRLGKTSDQAINYGPYGNADPWPFSLTSLPATPLISASKTTITADGETTISWVYSSADGTPQASAILYEVTEENGQKVYNKLKDIGSEQYVNIKANDESLTWSSGEQHTLVVTVQSEAGESSQNYSNEVIITVVEPVKCKIVDLSITDGILRSMPITFRAIEDYVLTEDVTVVQDKNYYERSDIAEYVYTEIGEIEDPRYQEVFNPEGSPSDQGWYEYSNDEYILTQDTEIVEGKTYYVKFVENPHNNEWYELVDSDYVLTEDTTITSGKTYYVRAGNPNYIYTLIQSPSGNPHTNGYFERKEIDSGNTVSAVIKRAENFKQDRPDETEFDGYEGETIYFGETTDGSFTINTGDANLVGFLDDRGAYTLELSVKDEYGQTSKDFVNFTVGWDHQAFPPEARVEVDQDSTVAFLYPIAPKSSIEYVLTADTEIDETKKYYEAVTVLNPIDEDVSTYFELSGSVYIYTTDTTVSSGKTYYLMTEVETPVVTDIGSYYEYTTIDVCDIYRLSVDKPELIYEGAMFGETYVDPYPTIGEFGGHRFVCRTPNGDYITGTDEDSEIAWIDTGEEDGDRFDTHGNIIDFDGEQAFLLYEVDLSTSWSKDFQETRYLGGSIQGDWNPGVSRTGSINVTAVSDYDQDMIRIMHKLADYPGVCHVRTKDGASYSADVQVNETYEYTRAPRFNKYDLSITKVNSESLDGMTLDEWRRNQEESE